MTKYRIFFFNIAQFFYSIVVYYIVVSVSQIIGLFVFFGFFLSPCRHCCTFECSVSVLCGFLIKLCDMEGEKVYK